VIEADFVTPAADAVMVTVFGAVTAVLVIGKLTWLAPAGMTTLAGGNATAGIELVSATVTGAPASPSSTTRCVEDAGLPPTNTAG
jgi:hypothetical protein